MFRAFELAELEIGVAEIARHLDIGRIKLLGLLKGGRGRLIIVPLERLQTLLIGSARFLHVLMGWPGYAFQLLPSRVQTSLVVFSRLYEHPPHIAKYRIVLAGPHCRPHAHAASISTFNIFPIAKFPSPAYCCRCKNRVTSNANDSARQVAVAVTWVA